MLHEIRESISCHISVNLYESREPAPWEIGPNQMISGHQLLAKTDANRILVYAKDAGI
jgi:hypothetical protein